MLTLRHILQRSIVSPNVIENVDITHRLNSNSLRIIDTLMLPFIKAMLKVHSIIDFFSAVDPHTLAVHRL